MKRKTLQESLTVSNEVKQISSEIKNELLMRLSEDSIVMSKEFTKVLKKGIFTYYTKGKLSIDTFKVKYYVTLYPNEKAYQKAKEGYTLNLNSECDYETNEIVLRLAMLNGNLTRESYGSIEHEVNHFLQNSLGQHKNETLYTKIKNILLNKEANQIYQRLAYALYLSFNTEISSFAVQYYSFLKNNKIPLECVYDDFPFDEGNPYNDFEVYKNYVYDYGKNVSDKFFMNLFGISKKEYFNRIENADKRYMNKMMKAATKYRDELNEKLRRKISESTNLSNALFAKRMNFEVKCYSKGIITEISEFD